MNNVIDFARAKLSRKMTDDLLRLDYASRCILYSAALPFLTDSDRNKINASLPIEDAMRISAAMDVEQKQ